VRPQAVVSVLGRVTRSGSVVAVLFALVVAACSSGPSAASGAAGATVTPVAPASSSLGAFPAASAPVASSPTGASSAPPSDPASGPVASETPEPQGGSGAASGDVPDNAVFLTYRDAVQRFAIQYVESWQVRTAADGVRISDKDSSEIVDVVSAGDAAAASAADLAALRALPGFSLVRHDRVKVNALTLDHLVYHLPSDPDPVTGKQVATTVDRYAVPGHGVVAFVALSTPDGVDNVDAFRQMIESFAWR
jgi:hypothetical protein